MPVKHLLNLNHGSLCSLGLKRVGEKSWSLHERMLRAITTSRHGSLLGAVAQGNRTSCTVTDRMAKLYL